MRKRRILGSLLMLALLLTLMAALGATAWAEGEEPSDLETPLTFEAKDNGVTVTLKFVGSDAQYKLKNGDWTDYSKGAAITLENQGDTVQFRGRNIQTNNVNHFTVAGSCYVYGNVMSLMYADEDDYKDKSKSVNRSQFCYLFNDSESLFNHDTRNIVLPAETLAENCYWGMFEGCSNLTRAPELPAETLAAYCYSNMFNGCKNLTAVPELPAKTLATGCYQFMFQGCSSLTAAPELPAETLAPYCYYNIFAYCTSLTRAPELPAETLAAFCYFTMFQGCTSLTRAPELPAETLADGCYYGMFQSCSNLTAAPELPAKTLALSCYYDMFAYCTSLTAAPELPAKTLADNCYYNMFAFCSSLNAVTCLATNISASNATHSWLFGVAKTGTFTKALTMTAWTTGSDGIPSGWTVRNKVTEPTITGADLVLSGSLDFRFYVAVPAGFDGSNAKMTFTIPGRNPETGKSGRTVEVPFSAADTSTDPATAGQKIFTCPVYSIEMAKQIEAVFSYGDNKTVTLTTSVENYLNNIASGSASALVAATKNYGHYMQPYLASLHGFTLGADTYPVMPYATEITALPDMKALSAYKHNGSRGSNVSAVGYFLTLNESTTLNLRLIFKNTPTDVSATVNNGAVTARTVQLNDTTWQVEIPNIAANNLGTVYHVVVTAGEETVYDVSAMSYVYSVLNANQTQGTTAENLALTALYNYFTAAHAYAGSGS